MAKHFRFFLFSVLFLLLPGRHRSFAATAYFDFSLQEPLVSQGQVYEVDFLYKIEGTPARLEKRFYIKPCAGGVLTEIYNPFSKSWVGSGNVWSAYPRLSKRFKVRFNIGALKKAEVCFEVLDTRTSVVHKTPIRWVWNESLHENYSAKLSKALKNEMWNSPAESTSAPSVLGAAKVPPNILGVPPAYLLCASAVFFLIFCGLAAMLKFGNEKT